MDKSPAFQFYPADWLDVRVMRMTYDAQGVYIRLLCHMWRDSRDQCSMAADPSAIASVLGLSMAKTMALLKQIQWKNDPIFIEQDGKYVSKRLQRVKAQQVQKSHAKSAAGKKGADSRWQPHHSAIPPAIVLPLANDSSSSSSSSASSSATKEGEKSPPPESIGRELRPREAGDDPREEVERKLMMLAVNASKCPSQESTIRKHVRALCARSDVGAAPLEQYLYSQDARGKTVNDWQDHFKSKNGGGNGTHGTSTFKPGKFALAPGELEQRLAERLEQREADAGSTGGTQT